MRNLGLTACLVALIPSAAMAQDTPECNEPDVLIVFDVSGSMGKANPGTKYTLATNAVVTATTSLDDELRFGLLMFPEPAGQHCDLDPTPQIPLALNNGGAFSSLLQPAGANFWGGPTANHDTPMFQALDAVTSLPQLQTLERRHYVVLITDGNQDCCIAGDYDNDNDCIPDSTDLDPTEAAENIADLVDTVKQLADMGIHTFVVGLQEKVSASALNQMAVAGLTPKPNCNVNQTDPAAANNCFYTADDKSSLEAALGAIALVIADEQCDGIDNDCDGDVDEDWPLLGQSCDGPDGDQCNLGINVCTSNKLGMICQETAPNLTEMCDGIDNDCDGAIDEDWPELGDACDSMDTDFCHAGTLICSEDSLSTTCYEPDQPIAERCDGVDNDCDDLIDEHWPMLGEKCDGDDKDGCDDGIWVCATDGSQAVCNDPEDNLQEVCNGKDDDCNGQTDEDAPCDEGFACMGGVCLPEQTDQGEPDEADAGVMPDAQDRGNTDDDLSGSTDADVGPSVADPGPPLVVEPSSGGGGIATGGDAGGPNNDGGCGCRASGPQPIPGGAALTLLLLAGAWLYTRRRRLVSTQCGSEGRNYSQ